MSAAQERSQQEPETDEKQENPRGADLLLETRKVAAAEDDPERFHLVIVENVRQGDPTEFRVLDITGNRLVGLLSRKQEKHCFEVPFPVAAYDELLAESI